MFAKAYALRLEVLGEQNIDTALTQLNLGRTERDLGNFTNADAAFDKFLIGIDDNFKVVISLFMKKNIKEPFYEPFFGRFDNQKIREHNKYEPNKDFLKWHLDKLKV